MPGRDVPRDRHRPRARLQEVVAAALEDERNADRQGHLVDAARDAGRQVQRCRGRIDRGLLLRGAGRRGRRRRGHGHGPRRARLGRARLRLRDQPARRRRPDPGLGVDGHGTGAVARRRSTTRACRFARTCSTTACRRSSSRRRSRCTSSRAAIPDGPFGAKEAGEGSLSGFLAGAHECDRRRDRAAPDRAAGLARPRARSADRAAARGAPQEIGGQPRRDRRALRWNTWHRSSSRVRATLVGSGAAPHRRSARAHRRRRHRSRAQPARRPGRAVGAGRPLRDRRLRRDRRYGGRRNDRRRRDARTPRRRRAAAARAAGARGGRADDRRPGPPHASPRSAATSASTRAACSTTRARGGGARTISASSTAATPATSRRRASAATRRSRATSRPLCSCLAPRSTSPARAARAGSRSAISTPTTAPHT